MQDPLLVCVVEGGTYIEKQVWDIVEGSIGEVDVMYGSDLYTSKYGSGFPLLVDEISTYANCTLWEEHTISPWNFNNFQNYMLLCLILWMIIL